MSNTVRIQVTQADIDVAISGVDTRLLASQSCPIYCALERTFSDPSYDEPIARVGSYFLESVQSEAVHWANDTDTRVISLPDVAIKFIANYDNHRLGDVRPFEFDMQLPG